MLLYIYVKNYKIFYLINNVQMQFIKSKKNTLEKQNAWCDY